LGVLKEGSPIAAHAVVCTVPLGVLKANSIEFSPSLPVDKREAISRLGVGSVNKVVIRFSTVFWDRECDWVGFNIDLDNPRGDITPSSSSSSGDAATLLNAPGPSKTGTSVGTSGSPRGSGVATGGGIGGVHRIRHNCWFLNYYTVVKEPILVAIISGTLATIFSNLNDKQIVSHLMRSVRCCYGESVPGPVDTVVTRWDKDEFSRGAYTYMRTGSSPRDLAALAAPAHDVLFFGGEATSETRFSYADGAYASGIREADRIIKLLVSPTASSSSSSSTAHSAHSKSKSKDGAVAQSKL